MQRVLPPEAPGGSTTQHAYKRALQIFQSRRLRRDHIDLVDDPQYCALGQFIFSEIYGPRDFSARDRQASGLRPLLRLLPGVGMHDIAELFSLLELTSALDDALAAELARLDAPLDFDEATYEHAYRLADNYAPRRRQLDLVRDVLCNMHRLAHIPLIGVPLRRSSGLATAMGLGDIHRFLRLGHRAFQPVRDIYSFVRTLDARERERLDRIYAAEPSGAPDLHNDVGRAQPTPHPTERDATLSATATGTG
jgi:hypothetical protein